MKTKINKIISVLLIVVVAFSSVLPVYAGQDSRSKTYFNDIITYKAGSKSVQSWIDSSLSSDAGNGSEWYILALSQNEKVSGNRYNYSNFENALIDYTKRVKNLNASSKLRIALTLASIGSTNSFISDTMDTAIGKQGIMSDIFGLHLLNNGYKSATHTKQNVTNKLKDMQCSDGGWALYGNKSDIDVTAMAVQALAPQYHSSSSVRVTIDNALNYLSLEQCSNGTFTAINGGNIVESCESTAQVILALASLNIDCLNDNRFIKNGNNLFDALSLFKSGNGFCHTVNGAVNELANQQVFYTMVGYNRMSNLYILDKARPHDVETSNGNSGDTNHSNGSNGSNSNSHNANNNSSANGGNANNSQSNTQSQNSSANNSQSVNDVSVLDANGNAVEASNQDDNISAENGENDAKETLDKADNTTQKKSNYKIWVILAICLITIIICAILYFTKKGNKGNYLIVVGVSVVAIIIVLLTNFQSVNGHKDAIIQKENAIGTVTISITCDTIADKDDNEFIPDDGIILDTAYVEIAENETVYDVLNEVCTLNDIQLETTGSTSSTYVEGINHIYELDYGDLSGWMYHVNGEEPGISCGSFTLNDGDSIEWKYTCDLGQDIKNN